jgi:orotate phosphoribosyltransferase
LRTAIGGQKRTFLVVSIWTIVLWLRNTVEDYQREFIEFMVRCEVLRFGDFTAKSGRKTPYFIDAGRYRTGAQLSQLARYYARAIRHEFDRDFDVLFGPAYKGIPLAAATALVLHDDHRLDVGFCFNRKEAKDHGEGGNLIGHALKAGDRVLIIEDVTTAGSSIRETVPLLRAAAAVKLVGLVVSVDRMERGTGTKSALAELRDVYAMRTSAIVTIDDVMSHLREHAVDGTRVLDDASYRRLLAYREQHAGSS